MSFAIPRYREPDFTALGLDGAPDVKLVPAERDGVMPCGYHATTLFPEYYHIGGRVGPGGGQPHGTAWLWCGTGRYPS